MSLWKQKIGFIHFVHLKVQDGCSTKGTGQVPQFWPKLLIFEFNSQLNYTPPNNHFLTACSYMQSYPLLLDRTSEQCGLAVLV